MEIFYCVGAILIGLFSYLAGKAKGRKEGFVAGAESYREFVLQSTNQLLAKMKNEVKNKGYDDDETL